MSISILQLHVEKGMFSENLRFQKINAERFQKINAEYCYRQYILYFLEAQDFVLFL